ncbi:MAG: GDP-mannose 4,6-dehydratase [Nanoarchaeota archaeon]|nr:GDP-mannose 4,6-dehydratase [Nanoarchaeota archaeon]
MKVLILGAGGFIGDHLSNFLLAKGCEVIGADLNLINKKIKVEKCDVLNKNDIKSILKKHHPDIIYHLAAQSFPAVSWSKPNLTFKVNIEGLINLFESVKDLRIDPLIILPCSSAEYGSLNKEQVPVKENSRLLPINPYGISKVVQGLLAYQYYKNFGIRYISARIFNATGPRRINDVCSDFTKRAVQIEKGIIEPILQVGNLKSRRAITDVRDVVKAFWLLINHGKVGEVYNICGDKVYSIQEILEKILEITGINPQIRQDANLLRPSDESIIVGDIEKIKMDAGWEPKIILEKTLKDMIEYWRLNL